MKAKSRLVNIIILIVFLTKCVSPERLPKPLHLKISVLDDNGKPATNTKVKILQWLDIGERFFCISLPTLAGPGKSCTIYKELPLLEDEVSSNGSLDLTVEYSGLLQIYTAGPCNYSTRSRRHMLREVWAEDFKERETITVIAPVDTISSQGYSIRYESCID